MRARRKARTHLYRTATLLINLQLVADLNPAGVDFSRRQLQHAVYLPADAGHPEWRQPPPQLNHLQASAQCDHIDGKQHPKGMNAGRRPDKKPASGIEPSSARQTHQAGQRCFGHCYLRTNRICLCSISKRHCFLSSHPFAVQHQLGGLSTAPAIDHNSKYNDCQHTCDESNDCCRIHLFFPPFS
jgi:hypothetical protein